MSLNHWDDGKPSFHSQTRQALPPAGLAPAGVASPEGLFSLPGVGPVVQSRLSILPPAGVNGETGEVSTLSRAARRATNAAKQGGIFKNTAKAPQPPSSNTGAKNADKETRALVDYLGCTFRGSSALEDAKSVFGMGEEWSDTGRGGYAYASCCRRGEVALYHGGEHNPDSVFVLASGKGCRQLEAEGLLTWFASIETEENPWQVFLRYLLSLGVTFPRFDVAIDDREGLTSLDTIEEYANSGRCCTRFRTHTRIQNRETSTGNIIGDTITFGSRQSLMFVRIYNKHLEQIVKGELPPDAAPEHWIRWELEAHNEKALALVKALAMYGMSAVARALWSAVDFKNPDDDGDTEKWRRGTVAWYQTFIDATSKLRLCLAPRVRSVEKVFKWVLEQVAPSLALLDNVPGQTGLIDALIQAGGERLRSVHFSMLKQAENRGFHGFSRSGALV